MATMSTQLQSLVAALGQAGVSLPAQGPPAVLQGQRLLTQYAALSPSSTANGGGGGSSPAAGD